MRTLPHLNDPAGISPPLVFTVAGTEVREGTGVREETAGEVKGVIDLRGVTDIKGNYFIFSSLVPDKIKRSIMLQRSNAVFI